MRAGFKKLDLRGVGFEKLDLRGVGFEKLDLRGGGFEKLQFNELQKLNSTCHSKNLTVPVSMNTLLSVGTCETNFV